MHTGKTLTHIKWKEKIFAITEFHFRNSRTVQNIQNTSEYYTKIRNHLIISTDVEKAFDKRTTPRDKSPEESKSYSKKGIYDTYKQHYGKQENKQKSKHFH